MITIMIMMVTIYLHIIQVAVKMLRPGSSSPSDLSDLVTEYSLMRDLDHPHVIKLLGACTDSRY